MQEQFQNHINNTLSFLKGSKLLIAISGGVDSVVLTHLCHQLPLDITLIHCNFNLRGKESDADEAFVLDLAEHLDLEVFIERFDTQDFAKQNKISIQMAARELRYTWFEDLAEQLQFDYILTGHHADDNLETFLINLSRGTGLEGLTGIPVINNKLVRPLLPFSRAAIEAYAQTKNLKWQEDITNASTKYLRNKIRHDVIPMLKEVNPQFLQNFQNTLSHLNDTAAIVDESVNAVLKRAIVKIDANHIAFKISEFKKVNNSKAYLYEVFKAYGFTAWDDILKLLDAQSGKQVFSKTHRLLKDRAHLLLSEIEREESAFILITEKEQPVKTSFGTLFFKEVDAISVNQSHTIYVDQDRLSFPLSVRKWQEGDTFYPFGMQGKKKLSKYFKDEKLSLLDKEKVWLLCSQNDIVWVIGRRADNRFKVTDKTKQILKISLK